jgi:3-oxoacyl-[acyl-carrier-protein] synthase II
MTRRVAVTGLGIVDPFEGLAPASGADLAPVSAPRRFFDRVAAGHSALLLYTTEEVPRAISVPAVRCAGFSADARLGRALAGMMDRFAHLGVAAARDAWTDAGLTSGAIDPAGAGVSWGTALGGLMAFERGYRDFWQHGRERVSPMSVVLGMNNAAAAHISIQLGLGNSALTYSVACASAASAIGEAFRHLRAGPAPVAPIMWPWAALVALTGRACAWGPNTSRRAAISIGSPSRVAVPCALT